MNGCCALRIAVFGFWPCNHARRHRAFGCATSEDHAAEVVQRQRGRLRLRYSTGDLLRSEEWRKGPEHELRLSDLLGGARQCREICEQQRSDLSRIGRK